MPDQDITDLYLNKVVRKETHEKKSSITDTYTQVINEGRDDPSAREGEESVTVFFSSDPEMVRKLHAAGGVEAREMSLKYFKAGILGRLDEQMSRIVRTLVQRAVGKMDEVALRGVYDVFQKYHISGRLVKSLYGNIKKADEEKIISGDILVNAINNIKRYGTLDIIPTMVDNCEQYGFIPEKDINGFVSELWDVKDVEGRTSVGKGELAMACLSVCRKGEPGDIKAGQDDDPDGDKINVSLVVGDPKQPVLAVEVKGLGGRPGTEGYGRTFFVSDAIKVLDKLPKPEPGSNPNVSYSQDQLDAAENAVAAKFRVEGGIEAQKANILNSLPEQSREAVSRLLDHATNSNNPIEGTQTSYRQAIKEYESSFTAGAKKMAGVEVTSTTGKYASIATMMDFKNEILTDGASMMKGLAFKKGVETFFWGVLPVLGGQIPVDQLADLIWSTRTDNVAMPDELKRTLMTMLTNGDIVTTNEVMLKQLVGAIQMTSYCGHDGFTHAMFVNDDNPVKRSLVVKTYKDDLNQTFLNIFDAFKDNGVDCPLSIDKQNKGVQIKFRG